VQLGLLTCGAAYPLKSTTEAPASSRTADIRNQAVNGGIGWTLFYVLRDEHPVTFVGVTLDKLSCNGRSEQEKRCSNGENIA
jgi:hypothetical protein